MIIVTLMSLRRQNVPVEQHFGSPTEGKRLISTTNIFNNILFFHVSLH